MDVDLNTGMDVKAAAAHLGLSPQRVRQLIRDGVLPAERLAGRWVLDREAVRRAAERRTPGRPLSPRMAWGLVSLIETGDAPEMSAAERSRWRSRLRLGLPLAELARRCRARNRVQRFRAHPGVLHIAAEFPGAVGTGSTARMHDIIDARLVEIYLRHADLTELSRKLRLTPASPSSANLVVRIPTSGHWPFAGPKAGPVAVALDLWDAGDSRSRRAAEKLYDEAIDTARFDRRQRRST
jgi:hypothetical protein